MKLAALALGAAFAFAVAEVGVRIFVDVKGQGPIEVRGVDPDHPVSFLPNATHRYETSEFSYEVAFNSRGRRDVEWSPETIASPDGILFVGDSFTLGNGLHHEQTIPTRLEALLSNRARPVEVFNFGMPGGGPPQYEQLLGEAIDDGFRASRVVVMLFVGNDFYASVLDDPAFDPERRRALQEERANSAKPLFRSELVRVVRLRLAQSTLVVDWILVAGKWLGRSLYTSPTAYIFQRELAPEQQETVDQILASLRRMQLRCRAAGREFAVVLMPNRIQVENAEALTTSTMDPASPGRQLAKLCASLDLACLDLLPLLRSEYEQSGEPLYYRIDRHLNPGGAELAATAIAAFLKERLTP